MRLPEQTKPVDRTVSPARLLLAPGITAADVCIGVTYDDGKICADFPIIGKKCIHISGLPSGSGSAKACVSYKFPDCANICVYIKSTKIGCVTQCLT